MRWWTTREVNWLKANYLSLGADVCSRHLNRGRQSVLDAAKRYGIARVYHGRLVRQQMRELYNAGYTDREIGGELNLSKGAIRWWRKQNRLPARNVGGTEGFRERLIDYQGRALVSTLFREGFDDDQIAQRLGIQTRSLVRKRRSMGLYRRKSLETA